MSVAYRLKHEDGSITEVEQVQRVMKTPNYRALYTDYDGVPVYEAPKVHVPSKPVQQGCGVIGRLQSFREEKKLQEEFKNTLAVKSKEREDILKQNQLFDEWRKAKKDSGNQAQVQTMTEHYSELEQGSMTLSEEEFEAKTDAYHQQKMVEESNERKVLEAERIVQTREQLQEKVALYSNGEGHSQIIYAEAQAELDSLDEKFDADGYPTKQAESMDEQS